MINLTPIAKPIQERLFEKMRVLGRGKKYIGQPSKADELQLQDMATRTTFIRMTSGQEHPVVMMGGELLEKADKNLKIYKDYVKGYNEIYGPREYISTDPTKDFEIVGKNKIKRPMPGIKSIDVQFKGGVRALRTATISWSCWSFEDLDRLMTHFLAHGKTVALEWGWVYNKKQFEHLPTLINSEGKIDETGFNDYRKVITTSKGDFDFMNGVIKNFEYTSRDDGGFDCKTDIVSTGVNILNSNSISGRSANRLKLYNIKEKDSPNEILRKLNEVKDDDEQLKQIFYDSDLSFSIFMTRFGGWLRNLVTRDVIQKEVNTQTGKDEMWSRHQKGKFVKDDLYKVAGNYNYVKNSFIVEMPRGQEKEADEEGILHFDGWVRWGWFEDNVLNKFCAMISKDNANEAVGILNEFRSVNRIIKNEEPTNTFESVKIKNHQFLESTNLKKYILPGQFEVGLHQKVDSGKNNIAVLAKIVNNKEIFNSFAVPDKNKREGYLRNILVHTDFLKECFDFTENITIKVGLENMFNGMLEDHNLWNLTLEADPVESHRIKIIDTNLTFYNWDINFNPKEQKSKFNDKGELTTYGVFTFPVWQNNSIVKKQDLSAKLPSSMQMAAMYGVNLDVYTNLQGSDQNMSLTGRAAGALGKMETTKDVYKSNADLAFRISDSGIKLGKSQGDESGPLNFTDGVDLKTGFFAKDLFQGVKTFIQEDLQEKIKEIKDSKIPEMESTWAWPNIVAGFKRWAAKGKQPIAMMGVTLIKEIKNGAPPPPTPDYLGRLASPATFGGDGEDFRAFIQNLDNLIGAPKEGGGEVTQEEIDKILSLYEKRYDSNMKLKPNFIEGMRYLLDYHGESRANNIPVLIPLELGLSIDGIGGIYPGNSYHSNYVPTRYQKEAIFQCFDVNHTVDSSGWTVTLNGKMRATLYGLYSEIYTAEENVDNLIKELMNDIKVAKSIKKDLTARNQLNTEGKGRVHAPQPGAQGPTFQGDNIVKKLTLQNPHPYLTQIGYSGVYFHNLSTGQLVDRNGKLLYSGG